MGKITKKLREEEVELCKACIQGKKPKELITKKKLIAYLKKSKYLTDDKKIDYNKLFYNLSRSKQFNEEIKFERIGMNGRGQYILLSEKTKIKRDDEFDAAIKKFQISVPYSLTPLEIDNNNISKIDNSIIPCMVIFKLPPKSDKVLAERYIDTLIFRIKKLYMQKGQLNKCNYLSINKLSTFSICMLFETKSDVEKFYDYLKK